MKKSVIIFGFSANPPANHHLTIIHKLIELFGKVIIIPRGTNSDKPSTSKTTPDQRRDMVNLIFANEPNVEIDFYDLDNSLFTPTWMIDQKYKARFPDSEIWHTVGGDIVDGGAENNSEIQKRWQKGSEIWTKLNWAVISHSNCPVNPDDLPPKNMLIKMGGFGGRSTDVRNRIATNLSISNLVSPKIEEYIVRNNLYKN